MKINQTHQYIHYLHIQIRMETSLVGLVSRQIVSLTLDLTQSLDIMHDFFVPYVFLHLLAQSIKISLLLGVEHLISHSVLIFIIVQHIFKIFQTKIILQH
jgi:hypothetical protein